ncbi:hypothetical protein V1460_13765 [Streptomyces sp. SCSIO 30461]|uniref:hypothetical protein n=1 Tax=Streptomyces sp. SCSIO 30461 TaxID=3118085 RepID=UPI0030CA9089
MNRATCCADAAVRAVVRAASQAAVRAAIVALTAIVALLCAPETVATAAVPGQSAPAPASSLPAEVPGEVAQDTAESEDLPRPLRRTERRGIQPHAGPVTAAPAQTDPYGEATPAGARPSPGASRTLVLRC